MGCRPNCSPSDRPMHAVRGSFPLVSARDCCLYIMILTIDMSGCSICWHLYVLYSFLLLDSCLQVEGDIRKMIVHWDLFMVRRMKHTLDQKCSESWWIWEASQHIYVVRYRWLCTLRDSHPFPSLQSSLYNCWSSWAAGTAGRRGLCTRPCTRWACPSPPFLQFTTECSRPRWVCHVHTYGM